MGVAQYDNKISQLQSSVSQCKRQISEMEKQIGQLDGLAESLGEYVKKLNDTSGLITDAFDSPIEILNGIVQKVRGAFFQLVTEAAKGPEYDKAVRNARSSRQAAQDKSAELRRRVEELNRKIGSYNSQISQTRQQRQAFLQEEARKAAEKTAEQ